MGRFSDDDLVVLRQLLQQAALEAYPNPERTGCPGIEVLKEVASSPAAFEHSAYDHVKRCSPCLKEMLDLRRERVLQQEGKPRRRLVFRYASLIAAAAALLVMVLWIKRDRGFQPSEDRSRQTQNAPARTGATTDAPVSLDVDLTALSRTRGGGPYEVIPPVKVPPKILNLRIALPFGSDDGQYELEIRKGSETLQRASGQAHIQKSDTILDVRHFDLTRVSKGRYDLFFKRAEGSWHSVPITVI